MALARCTWHMAQHVSTSLTSAFYSFLGQSLSSDLDAGQRDAVAELLDLALDLGKIAVTCTQSPSRLRESYSLVA